MARILFIATSHDRMLNGERTGLWLEELAVPYLVFRDAGHDVTISSVAGGTVPIDPRSEPSATETRLWVDAIEALDDTPAFDALRADAYDAVFMPGGHGAVFDMPFNRRLHDLIFEFDLTERPIAALCHAPAVFAGMRRHDGVPFINQRRIAAFTDAEENMEHGEDKVPFLVESRLKSLCADVVAGEPWVSNAVSDRCLVTGQNPQSAAAVAALVLGLL